jgi:hypothetical protein
VRIYEDHELVVENIEDWLADSKNKLYFVRRPDKYGFIHEPQHFLLTEKSDLEFPSPESDWNAETKHELLKVCMFMFEKELRTFTAPLEWTLFVHIWCQHGA